MLKLYASTDSRMDTPSSSPNTSSPLLSVNRILPGPRSNVWLFPDSSTSGFGLDEHASVHRLPLSGRDEKTDTSSLAQSAFAGRPIASASARAFFRCGLYQIQTLSGEGDEEGVLSRRMKWAVRERRAEWGRPAVHA